MSIHLRRAQERGHANHGWLDSYHTFSFADYYDVAHMGFRALRVINEDRVAGGEGFGRHAHRDMEIFSYVIEGALEHKDSMGHTSVLKAGDVQKITAGTGIEHSEFNGSQKHPVHFLQIWIVPNKRGLPPQYQEFAIGEKNLHSPLELIGSPQGGKNIIMFYQDVHVFRGQLKTDESCSCPLHPGRGIWIQVITGEIKVNEAILFAGDGAAIEDVEHLWMDAKTDAHFLLFDMA